MPCLARTFFTIHKSLSFNAHLDDEIISIVALLLIIRQIGIKNRLINLEVKPLEFIGWISYGIYVIRP
jgi:peptidoglycan/LPS O-acetylase OafA/YrhL